MKKSTSLLFKPFLFSFIFFPLLFLGAFNASGAGEWKETYYEIVSQNADDGRVLFDFLYQKVGQDDSEIPRESPVYLQYQNTSGTWVNCMKVYQHPNVDRDYKVEGISGTSAYWTSTPGGNENFKDWGAGNYHAYITMSNPSGIYNSTVNFQWVQDDKAIGSLFALTFYKPNAPISLQASTNECNQISLSWSEPSNIRPGSNRYYIYRNGSYLSSSTTTSYEDKTPVDGASYNYKVRMYNGSQYGEYSSEVEGNSKPTPEAPSNVTVSTDNCDGTVLVKWNWNTTAPEKFEVIRATSENGTYVSLISDLTGSQNYYEDTPPESNTTYYYQVRAKNDCNDWGTYSDPKQGYSPDAPADPSNFNYTIVDGIVKLSWTDNSQFEDNNILIRTNVNTGVIAEYELEADTKQFDDDDAQYCIRYKYELQAVNSCGNSNILTIKDVILIPDLSTTFKEGWFKASKGYYPDVIHLQWKNNNRKDLDLFYIYRKEYGSTDSTLLSTLGSTLSMYDDQYAENGVLYEYSIVGERLCNGKSVFSNVGIDVGFKVPTATVTGRVTFPAGTGVGGVSVSASTDDVISSSSLSLTNGAYISVPQTAEMNIESAFTFQSYLKFSGLNDYGIFEKSGNYSLTYESGKFKFYVGNEFVELEKEMTGNEFVHVSCLFDGSNAFIYIPGKISDADGSVKDTLFSNSASVSNSISNNDLDITFGYSKTLSFTGNIDEIRMWGRALEPTEILNDYNRYLSGKEDKMLAYWRINEGFGKNIYDISKTGSTFNENHGDFVSPDVSWSEVYPTLEQLGYRGISDLEGNYIIAGIPFTTGGSSYKFTPMMAPHEFTPDYKILFLNEDAPVINNVDFIDESVTKVTLTVYYDSTSYPVSDVMVMVDGNIISNENNEIVQTNEQGTLSFEVPLGSHYLSFEKVNHTFNKPFFPGKDSLGNILRHNFQKSEMLTIFDKTKVRLVGKVAGGPVEASKNLKSTTNPGIANIGKANIVLTTVKQGVLLQNGTNEISVQTNANGEYSLLLLPEKYIPQNTSPVSTKTHVFDADADLAVINLNNQFFDFYETDSLFQPENGKMVFTGLDTTINYNMRRDWIYRSDPEFGVYNEDEEEIFGEKQMEIKDEDDNPIETIDLYYTENDSIKYVFGKPIFQSREKYNILIKAFEKYENLDASEPVEDLVPVTDGKIKIVNEIANILKDVEYYINDLGEVHYEFIGDAPNTMVPYTNNLSITLITEQANKNWGPLEAYVLGDKSTGSNFTTEGPNLVDFILRDPPGSNSFAQIEKGSSLASYTEWSITNTTDIGLYLNIDFGPEIETTAGTPFFSKGTKLAVTADLDISAETSFTFGGGLNVSSSLSFSEKFSTSDASDFVGADGDVYVGHSTNIIFGVSKIFNIFPKDNQKVSDRIDSTGNYVLAFGEALRLNLRPKTYFVYSQRTIEEEIVPGLELLRDQGPADSIDAYNVLISNWEDNVLGYNEQLKSEAKPWIMHSNISFGAGSIYEASVEYETSAGTSVFTNITRTIGLEIAGGFKADDVGFILRGKISNSTSIDNSSGIQGDLSTSYGFTLSDQDPSNILTVNVEKDKTLLNGPVFKTLGGQTSCPWEDAYLTKYFEPGKVLSVSTMKIDGPELSVEGDPMSPQIPETLPAVFTLNLSNSSEAEKDNWYILGTDAASNPDGAKVKMDGTSILDGVAISVPYGETVQKTIEVYKGRADINDYEDLGIYLSSSCDDIADTVYLSAYFATACSPVEFVKPKQGWLVNFDNKDELKIEVSGYNLQHIGFEDIYFQYTPTGTANWITSHTFTNYELPPNTIDKTSIGTNSTVEFIWNMAELADRGYDLRLVSKCSDGSINYSETLSGILDGQLPQIFGTPQPADGILNIDDNILVQFNEPIEGGLLNQSYFDVKGILNNSPVKHDAFLRYNGSSDYSSIPEGLSFNDKSFTIEFWMRPEVYANSVIFSQGNDPAKSIEIGLRDTDKTYFKIGTKEFIAPFQFTQIVPSTSWQHMAYVYDYETGDIFIYQNDIIILEIRGESIAVNNSGKIYIGKSSTTGADYFEGCMHELRIWSKTWSIGEIYANQYNTLSGNEIGLYGYWPVNEAYGLLAIDKAAYRHMEVFAPWEVYPGGKAWDFSGNKCVEFFAGYFAIIPEMDFTMEFWFKDGTLADTVCLFSNQKGDGNDGDDLIEKALSVYATPDGKIWVRSKGNLFQATSKNYFDNSWHHFALIVRRNGNVKSFIDGEAQNEKENSEVGGIAGGRMNLGVRRWDNVKGTGEDWQYQGKMDEFRLWNLAKTNTQIKMDMNSKLRGDEIGLMVYFPFEGYYDNGFGGLTMEETLENFVSDLNATDADICSTKSFTYDAPNIKEARPIEDISFDYVASEDAIIITPKEFLMNQLEKNIIEITVEGVEDKYGNRLASPATWTAYVSRNQVRWEDERRYFTKEIYKPLTFVSTIKNTGGQQIGFSLENLPPWLTANPSGGTINPESTLEITFTINPALNIGEYNQDIILRIENGFDEKLPLTVRVHKSPPNWNVDASKFEYTMNVVGSVKIESVLSTDIFDMVAAFKRGTDSIRGVANIRYISDFDSYLVFLNVYGNVSGEQLEFRLWDASAGQILDDVTPDDTMFVANAVLGTTYNPLVFEAKNLFRQYIPLAKGWNWVSFNKQSKYQHDLNTFFASLEPKPNDQVKTHGGGFNNYSADWGWSVGGIPSIYNSRMYQMKISNPDTIIYSGEQLIPEAYPVALKTGWNHIGYIPDLSMDVNDALRLYTAASSEIIKSQYAFSMYDERVGWLGTLDLMQPGFGYMLYVKKDATLTYPNGTIFKDAKVPYYTSAPLGWGSDLSEYEGNISVVARLDISGASEAAINSNMVLGSFVNDECHGFCSPISNSGIGYTPFFLNVSNSENGQKVGFRLYDGATGNTYSIVETVPFVFDAVYGNTKEPMILTLGSLITGSGGIEKNTFFRCYPNPFNQQVNVEFSGTNESVTIDVVNANGSLVKNIYKGYPVSGTNTATWNGTNQTGVDVSAGMYYIRFVSGETVETVKISKTR